MVDGRADYMMFVSERAMKLNNTHMLLGDNDADWHTLLVVTIRNVASHNERKRTDEGEEKRWTRRKHYTEQASQASSSDAGLPDRFSAVKSARSHDRSRAYY